MANFRLFLCNFLSCVYCVAIYLERPIYASRWETPTFATSSLQSNKMHLILIHTGTGFCSYWTFNGAVQNAVASSLRALHLYIWTTKDWRAIRVKEVYATPAKWNSIYCTWKITFIRLWKAAASTSETNQQIDSDAPSQIFPSNGLLESVLTEMMGSLSTTLAEIESVLVMTDHQSRFAKTKAMPKTTVPGFALWFVQN